MPRRAVLMMQVLWELIAYDLLIAVFGFGGVHDWVRRRPGGGACTLPHLEQTIVDAVSCVGTFYWKRIRCLQRSVVTARILARYGVKSEVVIGYRPAPFFSHAWVEVNGRVANDLPGFQKLLILERL